MSLVVKNLYHTYQAGTPNESHALKDVNIEIKQGEFIGIIGHTGSGKSTLIQHFNGLLKPSQGTVLVDGVDINVKGAKLKEIRLQVGIVFQYPEHQLFEETVAKDVAFGPKNLGLTESEILLQVKQALQVVDLDYEAIKDQSPFDLSGGQKRRVAIAGVLAMNPKYLILDEPTAGLDPKGREDILQQVKKLHDELKLTVILVSHSMDDVARYADRMVVMHQGEVSLVGTPKEVFRHHEQLIAMGVGVPTVTTLLHRLAAKGMPVNTDIITIEEAKNEIIRALSLRGETDYA